ncbi:MAG: RNA polymerase subunit sigma-24 [candidate division Zixibacteria bacterium SM23_73_3]|nr:MAG: RNA polymerase subunit sigma-24 [candidate division Zixibacteria bacterium SM23_73_3]
MKGILLAKEDDQLLIKKALAGNEDAYRLLLNRYRDAIYRMILKIVHNQEEAQDLVQETFMKAFGSLASYKCQYRFTTWLYKIAANNCIDFLRKRRLLSVSLDQPLKTKDGEVRIELPDWSYNPEMDLATRQKSLSINVAIDSLPQKYREVIVFRHKQDKSYEEIAQILGIPVGTVKARIFRARELLKKKLKSLR